MNDASGGLLLDTHVMIWLTLDALSDGAADAIEQAGQADRLFVSPVSAWEIGLLARPELPDSRRLTFQPDPVAWFEQLAMAPIRLAQFSPAIAIGASFLPPGLHKDPADRLLVATARALDVSIMTRDGAILAYAEQGHVRAIAC